MRSSRIKTFIYSMCYLLMTSFGLVVFTNCSVDPFISEKNLSSQNDTFSEFEVHSHATWSPSDGGNFNQKVVRDPSSSIITNFSWDKVTILRSETTYVHHDFRDWPETSEITNYSLQGEWKTWDGRNQKGICLSHTRETQWAEPFMGPDFKGGQVEWVVAGSLWIIIPLKDGTIYATTSHHLNKVGHCVMGWHNEDLRGVMDNIGSHARKISWLKDATTVAGFAPIKNWNPEPGQILGIAVTSFNELKEKHPTYSEKSNLIWVKMPDPNQVSSTNEIVGRYSSSSDATTSTASSTFNSNPSGPIGQCDAPDHRSVARQVFRDHPDLLAKANNKKNKNWEFLEVLVEELRKVDTKWGFYHRTEHNLQEASLDAVAYYCGTGDPVNGSSDLRFIDVISSKLELYWGADEDGSRAHPDKGYWKYPRLGDTSGGQTGGGSTSGQQVGQCSRQPNHCITGEPHPHPKDTSTEYRWTCRNIPHSTGETRCTELRSMDNCGPAPHFKVADGRCLPSCGHAKNLYCQNNDCTGFTISRGDQCKNSNGYAIHLLETHEENTCCLRKSNTTNTSTTSTSTTQQGPFTERAERVPNMQHIVDRLFAQCPNKAQDLYDPSIQDWSDNREFVDLVIDALREEDTRFGYSVWDAKEHWATDKIFYYRGTDNPAGSNDVFMVDYIRGKTTNQSIHWGVETYEKVKEDWPNSNGQWRYPRPGARPIADILSECTGTP